MPEPIHYGIPRALLEKWRALAECRRDYYADIYQSGRWRHYFTDHALLIHTRQAVEHVEMWTNLIAARDSAGGRVPQANEVGWPAYARQAFAAAE